MSDLRAVTRVLSRDICYNIDENSIEEIRIRVDRPVILKYPEGKENIIDIRGKTVEEDKKINNRKT